MNHVSYYKEEYPRPQLWRPDYRILNGEWDFAFGEGENESLLSCGFDGKMKINVPFTYQTAMSGIGTEERHDEVWYSRSLCLDENEIQGRVILHLEGCDYETDVWVNGCHIGSDTGGYHRLSFDMSDAIHSGDNKLVIRARDDYSVEKPRGKQRSKDANYGCWYTDTTGIYKTAWVEFVSDTYIKEIVINPNANEGNVNISCQIEGALQENVLSATVTYNNKIVGKGSAAINNGATELTIRISEDEPIHLWSLDDPNLYEVELSLGKSDIVKSYFGLRNIDIADGKIFLNGKELYQKLALDQGYWRESLLTPPSEGALVQDIIDMADMGFNGVRKHQKVEDERYLYYADIMGFIVWAEMPSMYSNTENSRKVFEREWILAVNQQRNHPCVFAWVPFNESWGIEEIKTDKVVQDFVNDMYYKTKEIDKTRPVITNDGWEHTISDILTIHHYEQDGVKLHGYYDSIEKCGAEKWESHHKGAFADGYGYTGQPIIISEFGGTAFVSDTVGENWGYGVGVNNFDEFYARFESLIDAIDSLPYSCGYCYTQVTDVQQEVNGLLDFDHKSKFDKAKMKKILEKSGR